MSPQMDYIKDERADQEMDCIASDQNGQWTTFHCDDKFYSLCKKKLSTLMNTFRKSALPRLLSTNLNFPNERDWKELINQDV